MLNAFIKAADRRERRAIDAALARYYSSAISYHQEPLTMPRRDPAKAIAVLDAMLEFFDGGRRWWRGSMYDVSGERRCLIAALHHIRAEFAFRGDGILHLLHAALPDEWKKQTPIGCSIPKSLQPHHRLMYFNDTAATSYDDVRMLIVRARALAQAELDETRATGLSPPLGDSPALDFVSSAAK
jgi:hypothetical protein